MNSFLIHCTIIGLGILTSGCNPFQALRPNSEELVKLGWAKHPDCPGRPEPLYCYETLGYPVCHSAPLNDQSRLSNYYGPKP